MFVLKPNLENRIQIIYAIVWIDMFKKVINQSFLLKFCNWFCNI